jgi:hypothetical protein
MDSKKLRVVSVNYAIQVSGPVTALHTTITYLSSRNYVLIRDICL